MSGICALLRLDGGAAERASLAAVLASLAPRGPDGADIMASGPAVLGHALLATTPEALAEPMPLRHAPSGCIVTADVRLDNRAELIAALGLDPAGRVIGDGELVGAAYRKWGLDCPDRLLGDFAFVLWDARQQRLFAARDKTGMRQLTYCHQPGKLFVCATDPDALIAHPEVPKRLNEGRVADYLEQLEAIDHTSTFYRDVLRLPPAHALVIDGGQLRQWQYWQLTPTAVIRRASDADYEAAFCDVFAQAVQDRLRAAGPVGSMLSGGMDSGSVSAVAARLLHEAGAPPLLTFSGVDSDPACKESAGVRAAAATIPHITPIITSLDDPEAFRDAVIRLTTAESDPFDGHMALIRALYLAASRAGVKVMLDGVAGDTTLGTGNMVAYHLRAGRIGAAWAEARGEERMWGAEAPAVKAFLTAVRRSVVPDWLRQRRQRAWEQVEADRAAAASIISPELAAAVDMPARRRRNAAHIALSEASEPADQARRILHPYVIVGRERYDRVAGAQGVEPRDPFMDIRVIEFCLTLPPEQLQRDGWPKLILRRAMAGHLPDSVRWKRGRDHVGWRFAEICQPARGSELDDNIIAGLIRYGSDTTNGGDCALQCSNLRVVTDTDLFYLAAWLMKFNTPRD